MKVFLNILGIVVVLGLIVLISWDRKNIRWKAVGKAIIAQFIIAILLVKVPVGKMVVSAISDGVTAVINCGQNGLSFVFGSLADSSASTGSIFIVQTLGNIIFVSALVSLLYYLGILGFVVKWIGKAVGKLMGTTEVESFVAVANMFFALLRTLAEKTGLSGAVFTPLWKVLAIALTVRVGGAFCRDAAQGALASVLETAGAVCALTAAAPLLLAVVELVEGWL